MQLQSQLAPSQNILTGNRNLPSKSQQLPFFSTEGLSESLVPRLKPIVETLNAQTVDLRVLRGLLGGGISEEAVVIRQYVWKLVLGYLPRERSRWQEQVAAHDRTYHQAVRQFLSPQKYGPAPLHTSRKDPRWPLYEQDFVLWEQIEKDTCRTQAELAFFSAPAPHIPVPFFTNTRREKFRLILGDNSLTSRSCTFRYDYMTRILFVFARLHPRVEYVQGMNEILAPIFYLVNANRREEVQEAACFYMFNNVMSDILELHMRDFGKQENGVHLRMRNISTLLLALQPRVWHRLDSLKIDPFYYSFRWITLLFSQEFQMFETLRIWEAIFAHDDRTNYTNFFALALLLASKSRILAADYGQILADLKAISEHVEIEGVIGVADQLFRDYGRKEVGELAERNRRKLQREEGSSNRIVSFFRKLF